MEIFGQVIGEVFSPPCLSLSTCTNVLTHECTAVLANTPISTSISRGLNYAEHRVSDSAAAPEDDSLSDHHRVPATQPGDLDNSLSLPTRKLR